MSSTACAGPQRHWSTATVESRHALAYWVDTICESFLEIEIDSPARHQFHAQLDQADLGPATLSLVQADRQKIRRTHERIARTRYPTYFLLQIREGQARLTQYARESHLEPGDCVLIDCKEPYELDCVSTTRSVAVRFPQDWLRNWIPAPEDLAGYRFAAVSGWSTPLSAMLATLEIDGLAELALPAGVVAEQIAALLALAAGPQARAVPPGEKLFARLVRELCDRAQEPGLSPTDVAAAQGISTRYLHLAFAQAGTTFGKELMRVRLDCARRLLNDRRFQSLSIGEIAARCGFVDPSHFARRFRNRFGLGPSQARGVRDKASLRGSVRRIT